MNKTKIEEMTLVEILNYVKDTYGCDDITNLYIRCLDCDTFIPICEWNDNEDIIEHEICNECRKNEFLEDNEWGEDNE